MREALEAKKVTNQLPRPAEVGASSRIPFGDDPCPQCGWPCSKLQSDDGEHLTGPLYEHRSHPAPFGDHNWPQLHTCEPGPDECPFCQDCVNC